MRIVWRKLISMAIVIINRSGNELSVGVVMIARWTRFAIHHRHPTQTIVTRRGFLHSLGLTS